MAGLDINIVGGGIGGLTAALSLARLGMSVTVLEQAERITEIGAGIQISPNGSRVLHALGLGPELDAVAFRPEMSERRDWKTGEVLAGGPLGEAAVSTYGFPYYHIHRADLINVLATAAKLHPSIELRTGFKVHAVTRTDGAVAVAAETGEEIGADVLVGADGIKSVVRQQLFGADQPTFTGNIAWRNLIPVGKLPHGLIRPAATAWWGPGRHFVHYYVRAGAFVNCVAVVEKDGWEIESWTAKGDIAELRGDFDGWHADLQALMDAMNSETHRRPQRLRASNR